jgi:hypothetical protein
MEALQPITTQFRFQEGKHLAVAGRGSATAGAFGGHGSK